MTLLTDEMRALVGRRRSYTAPEPVGRAAIRYFARAVGDDNPLYTDDEYARRHRYGGVIAPPTMICETNQYADLPRDAHRWPLDIPGTRTVRGGNRYVFHRPVGPDDVVTAHWELTDLTERTTRDGRAMLVVTSTATYVDAAGEPLATNEETIIYVEAA